jgi:hypothetical protein
MPKGKTSLDRHTVDQDSALQDLPHVTRLIDGLLKPSERAPEFFLIAQAGFELAGLSAVIDLSRPEICRGMKTAAKSLSAMFAVAAAAGEIEVNIGDHEPRRLSSSGSNSFTHCGNWRNGFFAACICRDREALEILAHTPTQILRSSSSKSDEAYYQYVEAMQALWLRSKDTGAKLLAALKSTDPAILKLTPEDWVLNVLVPELDLASHLADGNAEPFNESLRFAIERHKNYWNKGDRKRKGTGFLAIGPLALASLAYDAGLTITVESDYLPSPLWQGSCSKS